MNIVLTAPAWPPAQYANGVVTYVGLLKEGLESLDVDVRVLVGRVNGERDPSVVKLARSRSLLALSPRVTRRIARRAMEDRIIAVDGSRRIVRAIQRMRPAFRPDLIEMEESFGTAGRVSKKLDIPLVVRLHGPWFLNGDALGVPKNRAFLRRIEVEGECIANAHAVTSPSQDLLERVRQKYQLELPDAAVIPNPAPPMNEAAHWKLSECDPNLVVYVGRFDRHKGGDLVVDAFAMVAADRPQLKLAFIGPDRGLQRASGVRARQSLDDYIEAKIPDLGIRKRIEHLGQMDSDEVTAWRKRARVVVVASRFEVFGMVVVEALAQGCPLVAADVGGIAEIVQHRSNGLLFRSSSAEDLARQLTTMLEDSALSEVLGDRGRRDMERRFAAPVVARQTKDFYAQVLDQSVGGPGF